MDKGSNLVVAFEKPEEFLPKLISIDKDTHNIIVF